MTGYEIRVKGKSTRDWADWFPELQAQTCGDDAQTEPELCLSGFLPDQSALLGVLMRLHNMNLNLLSIRIVNE